MRFFKRKVRKEKPRRWWHLDLQKLGPWGRGIMVLGFFFWLKLVELAIGAVCLVQFLLNLSQGQSSAQLKDLGRSLGLYVEQIVRFITYESEEKPWPFKSFPTFDEHRRLEIETQAVQLVEASESAALLGDKMEQSGNELVQVTQPVAEAEFEAIPAEKGRSK